MQLKNGGQCLVSEVLHSPGKDTFDLDTISRFQSVCHKAVWLFFLGVVIACLRYLQLGLFLCLGIVTARVVLFILKGSQVVFTNVFIF